MSYYLTDRELEIIQFVTEGMTTSWIACQLGISEKTVRSHIGRVIQKTRTTSRVQAVLVLLRRGVIKL